MTSRERVLDMIGFKPVDKAALEIDMDSVGFFEHGEKLRSLFKTCEGDFGPITDSLYNTMPGPEVYEPDGRGWLPLESEFDDTGRFHRYFTDAYGVNWEYRIFGVQGHPLNHPLNDWENAADYRFPTPMDDIQFEALKRDVEDKHAKGYFVKRGWVNYMERTYALRKFEDVLMDVYTRDEDFMRFTMRMHEHNMAQTKRYLEAGVDAVQFADDFGMQNTMLISPEDFRAVYKPLYKELCDEVKRAGRKCFYHVCRYVEPILDDLAEIGFDTIWPQINVYDLKSFAKKCRDIGLAVAIHPERSELMTNGTPDMVKKTMNDYIDAFRPMDGGSWFYVEIDNGFPYENIVAMIDVIRELRG